MIVLFCLELRCGHQDVYQSIMVFPLLQVLQYKKKCGDLEQMLQDRSSELEKHRPSVSGVC